MRECLLMVFIPLLLHSTNTPFTDSRAGSQKLFSLPMCKIIDDLDRFQAPWRAGLKKRRRAPRGAALNSAAARHGQALR